MMEAYGRVGQLHPLSPQYHLLLSGATIPNTNITMVRIKGPNFSMEEDVALTRGGWVKETLEPRVETNRTGADFWKKVFDFFKD